MISIIMTPPESLKAPNPNLYDAYNYLMEGNVGMARSTMAQFYRDGIPNPRARMYEASIEMKNILNVGISGIFQAPQTQKQELKLKHNFAMNELLATKHPLVERAKQQLKNSFKEKYPSHKTQAFSRFIVQKEIIPSLKKLKFLSRFF